MWRHRPNHSIGSSSKHRSRRDNHRSIRLTPFRYSHSNQTTRRVKPSRFPPNVQGFPHSTPVYPQRTKARATKSLREVKPPQEPPRSPLLSLGGATFFLPAIPNRPHETRSERYDAQSPMGFDGARCRRGALSNRGGGAIAGEGGRAARDEGSFFGGGGGRGIGTS